MNRTVTAVYDDHTLHMGDADEYIQPALHRVAELARLTADWDSYGAEPLSDVAVAKASELLFAVAEEMGSAFGERMRPYTVAPLASGGLQLAWRGTATDVEIEIGPQGDLAYLFVDRRRTERTFTEAEGVSPAAALGIIANALASDAANQTN